MDWKELGKKVMQVGAPLVGTALGGPGGGAIGAMVAGLFGADPEDPADIAAKIAGDPEAQLKLVELQHKHKERLEELVIEKARVDQDAERMRLADVASARSRQTESEKAVGKRDINLYVLAYLFVAGYFLTIVVMVAGVATGKIPSDIPQAVVMLIGSLFGTLSAAVGAVVQYFFGSSKSSSDKNVLIAAKGTGK